MRFNEFALSPELIPNRMRSDRRSGSSASNSEPSRTRDNQQGDLTSGPPYPPAQRDAVKAMQRKLVELGYSVGSTEDDGKYGPRTSRAVNAYKTDFNVRNTDNGRSMSVAELEQLQQARPKDNPTPTGNERQGRGSSSSGSAEGIQPGSLEGTSVLALNPDVDELPGQHIIKALDRAASALGIQVQITPQGGRRSRQSGTQNHPTGEAADIQIVKNGRIIRPGQDTGLYIRLVELLVSNAAKRGVRPGIGGYDWGIHYDESRWRQRGNGIAGTWGASFIQRGVRSADASNRGTTAA